MKTYNYIAKDQKANTVKAEVQAESESAAVRLLQEQNLLPVSITPQEEAGSLQRIFSKLTHRVKTKDKILFTRQLSTLINAGMPLVQSLKAVEGQLQSKPLQEIIEDVTTTVQSGKSFSEALSAYPKVFNTTYVSLVAAGETSGTLDEALERIANQQEKDAAIISKVRGAMIYPAIVLFVIIGVMIFLLLNVIPEVESLYSDLGEELPLLTRVLVSVSDFIIQYWYLTVLFSGLGIYALARYLHTPHGRRVLDKVVMKIPLFGPIFMKLYMARFSRTSSTLLETGVLMLESLNITAKAVNNVYVSESTQRASQEVKNGKALSAALTDDPNFLPLVPQMIHIGEQSGAIADMLAKIATYYEDELDQQIKNISTVIEPALMIIMGVLAAVIIGAILIPIYGLVGQNVAVIAPVYSLIGQLF